jgi:drug/metabolite transporter (DMT)-like permease
MPLFQYLATIFASGALTLALVQRNGPRPVRKRGQLRLSRWLAAAMVGLGLLVSDILFIRSLDYIGAAQANLILYLWPVMVVFIAIPLRLATIRRTHVIALGLALAGAVSVIGVGTGSLSTQGVLLAGGGGLAWAVYVVFRMWQGPEAPEALGLGLGLSAGVALVLCLAFEDPVMPSISAFVGTILVGVLPLALGNLAWDYGSRNGDRMLLATFAYATPLVSALLLIAFGLTRATTGLLIGGVLIVTAGIVAAR